MSYLCGPNRPTEADLTIVDQFRTWLATRARQPRMVTRPQDCDCGASQVALVAHWERCASRHTMSKEA